MIRDNVVRAAIRGTGGLANQGDLARAWGLSRSRVSELVKMPGFPEPVTTIGDRPVWSMLEAQAWRADRAATPRHARRD